MLLLEYLSKGIALVRYHSEEKLYPELSDWHTYYKTFTTIRHSYIKVDESWSEAEVWRYLKARRHASIYNLVAHNPIPLPAETKADVEHLAETQRIVIDGIPYIDHFGLYVYVTSRVAWHATSDVDLRYNANQYPYKHLEPEIELLYKTVYYDTSHR